MVCRLLQRVAPFVGTIAPRLVASVLLAESPEFRAAVLAPDADRDCMRSVKRQTLAENRAELRRETWLGALGNGWADSPSYVELPEIACR